MSLSLSQYFRSTHPVAHTVAGQAIQTIQGLYYAAAGIGVALVPQMIQPDGGSSLNLAHMWVVRAICLIVAGGGVALIGSGRREEGPFIGGGFAMLAALVLLVLEAAGLVFGALPPLFLMDAGMEFGFVCWWIVAILCCTGTTFGRSAQMTPFPHPPASA